MASWSPTPSFVELASGITLEVDLWGPPAGLPVLFIHGGYGGPVTTVLGRPPWFDLVLEPGDPIRLVRYSRRNAGASSYVFEPFDLADHADDALHLLDALGIDRAVIIGSSAGGPVALLFALAWPDRVYALGLPNTGAAIMSPSPTGFGGSYPPGVLARIDEVTGRMAIVDDVQRRGAAAVYRDRAADIRAGLVEQAVVRAEVLGVDPEPLLALAGAVDDDELYRQWSGAVLNWAALAGHDLYPRLGEIGALGMPTCIVHGDADDIVPFEFGAQLHAGIAGSELHRIPGGAHEITRDPAGAAVLRRWLLDLAYR